MKIYHPLRWRHGDTEKKMLRVFKLRSTASAFLFLLFSPAKRVVNLFDDAGLDL